MEYHLEIYRPGSCDSGSCIKTFTAATAFLPIRGGDLINTKTWEVEWPLLRVVNVEHIISEISRGIDPSGQNHPPNLALHRERARYRKREV